MTIALALSLLKPIILTASVYGPGVDRHYGQRVAYKSRLIAHSPAMGCAANKFRLGRWLRVTYKGKTVRVFNDDRTAKRYSDRIDLRIAAWRALAGPKRPGLLRGVVVEYDQ